MYDIYPISLSINSNLRKLMINELLVGQEWDYIAQRLSKANEVPLNFDKSDFYICLTGLRKKVYTGYYQVHVSEYMDIFSDFQQNMLVYANSHGYSGELELHLYGDKQIVFLFSSCSETDITPHQLVEYANNILQNEYKRRFLHDNRYCNFTVISPRIRSFSELSRNFETVCDWSKLCFFYMNSVVMCKERLDSLRIPYSRATIQDFMQKIKNSIYYRNEKELSQLWEDLFLKHLKYSFNYYLCNDVLTFLKQQYMLNCESYDVPVSEDVDSFFDLYKYAHIEELSQATLELMLSCFSDMRFYGRALSHISQEAIRYLKNNYCNPLLTVGELSKYLNVATGYLSRVFNKDTGVSIPQYIANLRIKHAYDLLINSHMKIVEIAEAVGYLDSHYFIQVFKRHTGCTPTAYRKKSQANFHINED